MAKEIPRQTAEKEWQDARQAIKTTLKEMNLPVTFGFALERIARREGAKQGTDFSEPFRAGLCMMAVLTDEALRAEAVQLTKEIHARLKEAKGEATDGIHQEEPH